MGGGEPLWWVLVKVLSLLAAMVLMARFLPQWLGKSKRVPGYQRHMQIIDVLHLGYDRTIYLVQVDEERLVIGASRQGMALLGKAKAPEGSVADPRVGEAEKD